MTDPGATMHEHLRRNAWRYRSNIRVQDRTSRLDDYTWPLIQARLTKAWLTRLLAGEVICAGGSRMCGKGLLLQGNPGAGKTTLVSAVLNEIISLAPTAGRGIFVENTMHTRRPVYYQRYDGLLNLTKTLFAARSDEDEDLRRVIRGVVPLGREYRDWSISVLVVDDLGKEHKSSWTESTFESLIRTRYDRGLPTIITTNVPLHEWEGVYGASAASFAHEAFVSVEMMGDLDRRRRR